MRFFATIALEKVGMIDAHNWGSAFIFRPANESSIYRFVALVPIAKI